MIINTYRWVKERCRSWSAAHEGSQKMGWLEVGTKLHCVEESGNWYRFDEPKMPLITPEYTKTWVHRDYLEIQSPTPEPAPPPQPDPGPVPPSPPPPVPQGDLEEAVAALRSHGIKSITLE